MEIMITLLLILGGIVLLYLAFWPRVSGCILFYVVQEKDQTKELPFRIVFKSVDSEFPDDLFMLDKLRFKSKEEAFDYINKNLFNKRKFYYFIISNMLQSDFDRYRIQDEHDFTGLTFVKLLY